MQAALPISVQQRPNRDVAAEMQGRSASKWPGHSEAVNFLVAEVARLQNSPRKLNSGEFSYQFFHSLSVTGQFESRSDSATFAPNQARQTLSAWLAELAELRRWEVRRGSPCYRRSS